MCVCERVCVCVCVCVHVREEGESGRAQRNGDHTYQSWVSSLLHIRWDKVYRCVCWVWELWQLYNNYMKQLDLAELSLGEL